MASPQVDPTQSTSPVRPGYDINKDFNKKFGIGLIIVGGGFALLSATLLTLLATGVIKPSGAFNMSPSSYKTMMIAIDSICIAAGSAAVVWGVCKIRASKIDKEEQLPQRTLLLTE